MRSSPQISGASSTKEPQAGAVNPSRTLFFLCRFDRVSRTSPGHSAACAAFPYGYLAFRTDSRAFFKYRPTSQRPCLTDSPSFSSTPASSPSPTALRSRLELAEGWQYGPTAIHHSVLLFRSMSSGQLPQVRRQGRCMCIVDQHELLAGSWQPDFLFYWLSCTWEAFHGSAREHSKAPSRRRMELQ